MIRVLIFLLLLAAAALGISWLVNHPGDISLNWQGYNVQTSVAVAAGLTAGSGPSGGARKRAMRRCRAA